MFQYLEELFDGGANFNATNMDNRTVLHDACSNWNYEIVLRIVNDFNGDVTKVDKNGITPVHMAILNNHIDMIECLIAGHRFSLQELHFGIRYLVDKCVDATNEWTQHF